MHDTECITAILLADIVGSTPLYEAVGNVRALEAIGHRLDAMRMAVRDLGGDFVHSRGDDVLATFESPAVALLAAARMLEEAASGQVKMRAGLHFGAIVRARGDIFGDSVNVTSRLATSANPGEVLVSQDFVDTLPPNQRTGLRHLDRMLFKGKREAFDVYSMVGQDLSDSTQTAFGPLQARRSRNRSAKAFVLRLSHGTVSRSCAADQTVTIGRSIECDLVVNLQWVSRHHATVSLAGDRARLSDRSTAGTYIRVGPANEIFIRREDAFLFGSGIISLGVSTGNDDGQIIRYTMEPD